MEIFWCFKNENEALREYFLMLLITAAVLNVFIGDTYIKQHVDVDGFSSERVIQEAVLCLCCPLPSNFMKFIIKSRIFLPDFGSKKIVTHAVNT